MSLEFWAVSFAMLQAISESSEFGSCTDIDDLMGRSKTAGKRSPANSRLIACRLLAWCSAKSFTSCPGTPQPNRFLDLLRRSRGAARI